MALLYRPIAGYRSGQLPISASAGAPSAASNQPGPSRQQLLHHALLEGAGSNHYRDKDQDEIDIVVESDSAALVGIEVKAASTVNTADFKGLRKLAAACEEDFKLGVVFYDGENVVPFGNRLFAAPMACLWG